MAVISMKQLLEAGVHFGHQTRRWNPKMRKYIYAARNDIHIIDLQITVQLIEEAYKFVAETVQQGKSVLFVGTKKQAQEAIAQEAERCGQYYINSRWLGGTLTNFKTIRSRIDRLNKLMMMEKMGEFELLPKKEVLGLKKEMEKLNANLGGIREMRTAPGVMFIVDPDYEKIAVTEAIKLNIPIVAITDTNCDPDLIDYVIPGNDDAIRAVKLISSVIADAVIEANQGEAYVGVSEEIVMDVAAADVATAALSKEEAIAEQEAKEEAEAAAKKAKAKKTEEVVAEAPAVEEKAAEEAPVKKARAKKAEEVVAEVPAVEEKAETEAPVKKTRAKKADAPAAEEVAEAAPVKKTRAKKADAEAPAADAPAAEEAPVKKTRAKKAADESEKA